VIMSGYGLGVRGAWPGYHWQPMASNKKTAIEDDVDDLDGSHYAIAPYRP
jgi:hypothetical protein